MPTFYGGVAYRPVSAGLTTPTYITNFLSPAAAQPQAVTVSGISAHDTLIMTAMCDNGFSEAAYSNFTWPAGFVQIGARSLSTDALVCGVAIKVDASGSEGVLSVSNSDTYDMICSAHQFRGVDVAAYSAFTADIAWNNTGMASPWTQASASCLPTVNKALLVAINFSDIITSNTASIHTFATTSGTTGAWTTQAEIDRPGGSPGPFQHALATATQVTAGSFVVTATGTNAGKTAGRVLFTLGLKGV